MTDTPWHPGYDVAQNASGRTVHVCRGCGTPVGKPSLRLHAANCPPRTESCEPECSLIGVRVGARVAKSLSSSWLFDSPHEAGHGYGEAGRTLVVKCRAAKGWLRSTATLRLTRAEAEVLVDLVDMVVGASADDATWDSSARNERNAGRRLLAKLGAQGIRPPA